MNNELMLDVGQANEFKLACRREGLTNEDIKILCERRGLLGQFRDVLLNRSEIKPIEHLVDFDTPPSIPQGWTILPDAEQLPARMKGKMKFDPKKVGLHLDNGQKNGKVIQGNDLRKKLEKVPVFGAQLLDFLLENPHLIPEEWKGKAVFFWGTIYRDTVGDLYVRCLGWHGDRGYWDYHWLDYDWSGNDPSAVLAN
ncbi:hypothetical protein IT397_00605 [Candidatus Nomurabacteria bacterium]|nr:hypothetical protein [Candidatus Nomurabacteria bacterium]